MIQPRHWLPLVLPLALVAAAVIAQPATPESSEAGPGTASPAPTDAPGPGQAAAEQNKDQKQGNAPARNESPFDYRPSEEISEDLPVSFPVDI